MSTLPPCPECASEFTYEDRDFLVCPECAHEWSPSAEADDGAKEQVITDCNGNVLQNGDSVSLTKDLKVKGTSSVVKVGTKVKNIRLVDNAAGDHDIDCKVPGIGAIYLKSKFVKKV